MSSSSPPAQPSCARVLLLGSGHFNPCLKSLGGPHCLKGDVHLRRSGIRCCVLLLFPGEPPLPSRTCRNLQRASAFAAPAHPQHPPHPGAWRLSSVLLPTAALAGAGAPSLSCHPWNLARVSIHRPRASWAFPRYQAERRVCLFSWGQFPAGIVQQPAAVGALSRDVAILGPFCLGDPGHIPQLP